ncbi:MAG TPA: hypothetical protein VKA87_11565 [Nitrososphaeraceae archaeon]|nr:hypothetical protein [Nitrososphaeraceae archaeon]
MKRISLMLRYRYEKIDGSYLFAQLLNRNHSYTSTLDKFMSVIIMGLLMVGGRDIREIKIKDDS